MADGADLELQAAMNAHLLADPNVQALLGTPPRIYQDVPTAPIFPYATIGDSTETDDSNECQTVSDILADIHVWSREPGYEEAKRIAWAIRFSLNRVKLSLATMRCVLIEHSVTRQMRDPDVPAKHGIVTFHARVEL